MLTSPWRSREADDLVAGVIKIHVTLCYRLVESISVFGRNSHVHRVMFEACLITIIQLFFVEVVLHEAVDIQWPLTNSRLSATSLISRRGKFSLTEIKSILHHVVFLLGILRKRFVTQKSCRVVNSGHFFKLADLIERLRLHLTVVYVVEAAFSRLGSSVSAWRIITSAVLLYDSHSEPRLSGPWLPI